MVVFPRTCLSKNAPYTRAQTIWVTRERRIVLPVVEGYSEEDHPGVMIYELDFDLNVISARPDSHFWRAIVRSKQRASWGIPGPRKKPFSCGAV